jgi:hypothetical protein
LKQIPVEEKRFYETREESDFTCSILLVFIAMVLCMIALSIKCLCGDLPMTSMDGSVISLATPLAQGR